MVVKIQKLKCSTVGIFFEGFWYDYMWKVSNSNKFIKYLMNICYVSRRYLTVFNTALIKSIKIFLMVTVIMHSKYNIN